MESQDLQFQGKAVFTWRAVITRDRTLLTAATTISPTLVKEFASSSSSEVETLLVSSTLSTLLTLKSSLLESSLEGTKGKMSCL